MSTNSRSLKSRNGTKYSILIGYASVQTSLEMLNVIIFFTETDKIPSCNDGIRFLEMHEMARVKRGYETKYSNRNLFRRNPQTCKELLERSLESLVRFSENALGMKTAVVKTECHHFVAASSNNNQYENSFQYDQTPTSYKAKRKKINENNGNLILSPEHTEVFKIRVKRNISGGEEFQNPENRKAKKSDWDVLDIMSHVRFSFFGNLFDNEKKMLSEEENDVLTNLNENYPDLSSLFETVRSTLDNLQETPCNGFLMVVFGGHLHEISDIHSPLTQSLKHVIEVTDPENTLIVVTSACPEIKRNEHNIIEIKEGVKMVQNLTMLPVYARGPKSECLTQCTVLYDVPLSVKNILEEISPAFKRT
ncbi:uncharacterized protein LOC130895724 [Diorhabda carinulata]|uniref:uncharacterized protein LOC130895724 n=1 Tax=Diorhabda carinulata TaxID=1163345 RepID=UPI0025A0FEAB|nr:uncharacterized protein LOC130895724 [Diorhabda carinulata]